MQKKKIKRKYDQLLMGWRTTLNYIYRVSMKTKQTREFLQIESKRGYDAIRRQLEGARVASRIRAGENPLPRCVFVARRRPWNPRKIGDANEEREVELKEDQSIRNRFSKEHGDHRAKKGNGV